MTTQSPNDGSLQIRRLIAGPLDNNMYIVACGATAAAVIIDAADDVDLIVAAVADLEPVAILTTHGHHDHIGAAAETSRRLGIPIRIHRADSDRAGIEPDSPLEHGEAIAVGRQRLRIIHTPGHTAGSVCVTVGPHLFSGDTLFPGGPGATGRPGSDFAQIIESIRDRLFTLADDTQVHPGHGAATTIGIERPHLRRVDRARLVIRPSMACPQACTVRSSLLRT